MIETDCDLIYVYDQELFQPQTVETSVYHAIFQGSNCSLSDARYKLLSGQNGLCNLTTETTQQLIASIDDNQIKQQTYREIDNILTSVGKYPRFGFTRHVDWIKSIETIRTRLLSRSAPRESSIPLHDITTRIIFLTCLGMQRYRDSGEVWCAHAVSRLYTYPVWSTLLRYVHLRQRKYGRLLKELYFEFQVFQTMELNRYDVLPRETISVNHLFRGTGPRPESDPSS
jgi:hypothetical protein